MVQAVSIRFDCNISINRGNSPWIPAKAGIQHTILKMYFPDLLRTKQSEVLVSY
jgi:hypothetical protein